MERKYKMAMAPASARKCKDWKNNEYTLDEFIGEFVANPIRTDETMAEFQSWKHDTGPDTKVASKTKADAAKDHGGFFLGELAPDRNTGSLRRVKENVLGLSMLGFDINHVEDLTIDDVERRMRAGLPDGTSYLVYPTHSHSDAAACVRVLVPADRDITPEEYEPCARKVAERCGILDVLDASCLDVNRMYFFPTLSKDAPNGFRVSHGKPLGVDDILSRYNGVWQDPALWPRSEAERERKGIPGPRRVAPKHDGATERLRDPRTKEGIHGAFCRVHDVPGAIDAYLSGIYVKGEQKGRYTLIGTSTTDGLAVYDDRQYAFSFHGTAPARTGHCLDSFDLVMLHLCGEGPGALTMMRQLCLKDARVMEELDKADLARMDDNPSLGTGANCAPAPEAKPGWLLAIQEKNGNIPPTIANIRAILDNDPALKDAIWLDAFAGAPMAGPTLPWKARRGDTKATQWDDGDDSTLREHMEAKYGISRKATIMDALTNLFEDDKRHPVMEYQGGLEPWDGRKALYIRTADRTTRKNAKVQESGESGSPAGRNEALNVHGLNSSPTCAWDSPKHCQP